MLPVRADESCDLLPIDLRRSKAQFFFKCLFEYRYVAVFAENKGDDEPIVPRADLTIRPDVSRKSSQFFPGRGQPGDEYFESLTVLPARLAQWLCQSARRT